MKKIKGIWDYL